MREIIGSKLKPMAFTFVFGTFNFNYHFHFTPVDLNIPIHVDYFRPTLNMVVSVGEFVVQYTWYLGWFTTWNIHPWAFIDGLLHRKIRQLSGLHDVFTCHYRWFRMNLWQKQSIISGHTLENAALCLVKVVWSPKSSPDLSKSQITNVLSS